MSLWKTFVGMNHPRVKQYVLRVGVVVYCRNEGKNNLNNTTMAIALVKAGGQNLDKRKNI